jgi:hypothetical protein
LLLSSFASVHFQALFAAEDWAARKFDRADHSFALSDDDVGSKPGAAEALARAVRTTFVGFLGCVLEPVKLDRENAGSLMSGQDNSAHFIALLLDNSYCLCSFFDVVTVVFTKDEARRLIGNVSELDLLFETELSWHY